MNLQSKYCFVILKLYCCYYVNMQLLILICKPNITILNFIYICCLLEKKIYLCKHKEEVALYALNVLIRL